MARVIEVTGKDIEEAKKLALSQLDLPQERVIFEVLEEPSKGFFGLIGARVAKIRATEKELTPLEKGQEFLKKIFKSMHKDIQIECIEEDINYKFNLIGDDLGVLIGKHGQTLDSLQYLTNMAANKNVTGARVRIVLDVEILTKIFVMKMKQIKFLWGQHYKGLLQNKKEGILPLFFIFEFCVDKRYKISI